MRRLVPYVYIHLALDSPLSLKYVCFCAQSFREELEVLIQEQMKKGGSSSNLWALRQLADFMATHGSPAALPVSPSSKGKLSPHRDGQHERSLQGQSQSIIKYLFLKPLSCFVLFLLCFLNQFEAFSLLFPNQSSFN